MVIVVGVLFGIVLLVIEIGVRRWWERRKGRRRRIVEECPMCMKQLARDREMHLFVSDPKVEVEAELGGFGGTFSAVAFCGEHCPGGCRNPRCAKLAV